MRFTEHELTAALTGAAKAMLATRRKDVRRGRTDIDTVWNEMSPYQRFQLLDRLGDQILPVLVALPDVQVEAGTRPTYSSAQIRDAVESRLEDRQGRMRRAVVIKARSLLVQSALDHLPPRNDPDALT